MSDNTFSTVYTCSPNIRWAKDVGQIVIIDEQHRKTYSLCGIDATIWGWLSLRYSYQKLTHLLAVLLIVSEPYAEQILRTTLNEWHAQGLLDLVERPPHG